jgi:hypothetical protein
MKTNKGTYLFVGIVILLGVMVLFLQTVLRQESLQPESNIEPDNTKKASDAVQTTNRKNIISSTIEQPRPLERDEPVPADVKQALQHGAKAKVTFRVTDATGKAVEGAVIAGAFYNHGKKGYGFRGFTDRDGLLEQENVCVLDLNYSVEKEGHYRSSGRHWFFKDRTDCVENNRWVPWNSVIDVTLKEMRKPISMYVKRVEIILPKKDKAFGFDFKKAELVNPYGGGNYADILLMCSGDQSSQGSLNFSKSLTMTSSSNNDGFIVRQKDAFSKLMSDHLAPEDGYVSEIKLKIKRTQEEVQEQIEITDNECVLFRSRTEMKDGSIVHANYGKIYGEIWYGVANNGQEGARVSFLYYFNPTPNDRNLEFDGKNNLFKPDWNDSMNKITQP